jgi:methyltransferase-like protein
MKKEFKWDGRSRVPTKKYKENYNRIFNLPKLKQDIVKSITQTDNNKKFGDLVENIIKRKMMEKK